MNLYVIFSFFWCFHCLQTDCDERRWLSPAPVWHGATGMLERLKRPAARDRTDGGGNLVTRCGNKFRGIKGRLQPSENYTAALGDEFAEAFMQYDSQRSGQ
jgi:hypothetical protein